jgi:NAD(P)-dependent dehydrogenase (short-subunit alcohol dehydrogenase family)
MSDSWRAVVLVNNAGVLENARVPTREWVERSLATNLLAPFLLTRRLAPRLAESAPSRVVKAHVGVLGCLLRRFGRSGGCGLLDEFLSTRPVLSSPASMRRRARRACPCRGRRLVGAAPTVEWS